MSWQEDLKASVRDQRDAIAEQTVIIASMATKVDTMWKVFIGAIMLVIGIAVKKGFF